MRASSPVSILSAATRYAVVRSNRHPAHAARTAVLSRMVGEREGGARECPCGSLVWHPCHLHHEACRVERGRRSADDECLYRCYRGPRDPERGRSVRPQFPERAGHPVLCPFRPRALPRSRQRAGSARHDPRRVRTLRGVRPSGSAPAHHAYLPLERRCRAPALRTRHAHGRIPQGSPPVCRDPGPYPCAPQKTQRETACNPEAAGGERPQPVRDPGKDSRHCERYRGDLCAGAPARRRLLHEDRRLSDRRGMARGNLSGGTRKYLVIEETRSRSRRDRAAGCRLRSGLWQEKRLCTLRRRAVPSVWLPQSW